MTDIIDRLKRWTGRKVGDPMPENLPNNWGPALSADLDDAIAEIIRLRAMQPKK